VMHDSMQYDPIQGQGHERFKVEFVAVLSSWEGNWHDVSLTMSYRLCGISSYVLHGLKMGDNWLTHTPVVGWQPYILYNGPIWSPGLYCSLIDL